MHRIVGAGAIVSAALGLFVPVVGSTEPDRKEREAKATPEHRLELPTSPRPLPLGAPAKGEGAREGHYRNPRRTAIVEVVERVRGAVVNIHSERTVHGPASEELFAHSPSQNRVNGMGTGIVVDPRGYIITNQHVVEDVNVIRVRLSDGSTHNARVLTRDHESDLALLKVDDCPVLPMIPLGTSSDLMVGETVIAIGNAYGYEHTVTVGIVSAIKRDVTLNREVAYKSLIQTDASINPGNSGGPLLNINGELIGVNVAIRAGAQGIGFAIPVDSMMQVAADMLSTRRRNGTWHGLVCRDCVGDLESERLAFRDESEKGKEPSQFPPPLAGSSPLARWLVVERTEPASPAAGAGLKTGDVVLQVGGIRVSSGLDLERAMLDRNVGDGVPILIRRKGAEQRVQVVLQSAERATPPPTDLVWRKLGVRLSAVNAEAVSRSNRQLHGGLAVMELDPDGAAAKAGIQRGDILVGLHQWETVTLDNVTFVLTHHDLATFNPLRFFILRGGLVHKGWLQQID
jgi:serine protease Do